MTATYLPWASPADDSVCCSAPWFHHGLHSLPAAVTPINDLLTICRWPQIQKRLEDQRLFMEIDLSKQQWRVVDDYANNLKRMHDGGLDCCYCEGDLGRQTTGSNLSMCHRTARALLTSDKRHTSTYQSLCNPQKLSKVFPTAAATSFKTHCEFVYLIEQRYSLSLTTVISAPTQPIFQQTASKIQHFN